MRKAAFDVPWSNTATRSAIVGAERTAAGLTLAVGSTVTTGNGSAERGAIAGSSGSGIGSSLVTDTGGKKIAAGDVVSPAN